MDNHGLNPADTAMAVLIQPLVAARASGGGLSETAEGQMLISATWGLGSAIAQGEVVPDRIVLSRQGFVRKIEAGRKDHRETCGHGGTAPQAVPAELVREPCLDAGQAVTLGRLMRKAEDAAWACRSRSNGRSTTRASSCCRRGRCTCSRRMCRTRSGCTHPGLNGHPAGIGWGSGRAVVVNCECELSRVAPGDVLVTKVAGPGAQPHPAARRRRGGGARRLDLASRLARARARHPDGARRARRHAAHSRTARRSRSTASPASCGGCADGAKSTAAHLRHPADRRERAQAPARGRRASRSIRTTAGSSRSRR